MRTGFLWPFWKFNPYHDAKSGRFTYRPDNPKGLGILLWTQSLFEQGRTGAGAVPTGPAHAAGVRWTGQAIVQSAVVSGGSIRRNPTEKELKTAVATRKRMFGDVSDAAVVAAVGAPDGSTVEVRAGARTVDVTVHNPQYGLTLIRSFKKDSDGNRYVHNDLFTLRAGSPKGLGTEILARQAAALSKMGFDRMETSAAGTKEAADRGSWNGYYTWARLGYDAKLQEGQRKALPASMRHAETLHELFAMPGGAAAWKESGSWFEGKFSLKKGSQSVKILNAYLQERETGWKGQGARGS